MREAVRHGTRVRGRELGLCALASALLHVGGVALLALAPASQASASKERVELVDVDALVLAPATWAPPTSGGDDSTGPRAQAPAAVQPTSRNARVAPRLVAVAMRSATNAQAGTAPTFPAPSGDGDGGAPFAGAGDAGAGTGSGSGFDAGTPTFATIPFGEGMTPPHLVSGPAQPAYTREALEARVEGKVVARCTLTEAGALTACHILKGLPFLSEAVLATLAAQRYSPVFFQGRPQSVFYTLAFRYELPP